MIDFDLSDPSEGMMEVKLGEGQEPVRLDVFEAHNRFCQIESETKEKPIHERHAAFVDLMETYKLPRRSHKAAFRLRDAITEEVIRLEKKAESATGSPAESPTSTDSTVSTGP